MAESDVTAPQHVIVGLPARLLWSDRVSACQSAHRPCLPETPVLAVSSLACYTGGPPVALVAPSAILTEGEDLQ